MNPADLAALLSNVLNAIYTVFLIIGVLGSIIVWLLAQRFLSKKSFGEVLARKEAELKAAEEAREKEIKLLEARIVQLETNHQLMKSPMEGIAAGVAAVQVQLTALTKQVGEMGTKLAVQEALATKKQ
jgi:hypothetical protein